MKPKRPEDYYYRKKIWDDNKLKEKYDYIRKNGFIEACKNGIIKNIRLSNSGGKDSIALLLWCKENKIDKYCNLTSQTVDTGLDFYGVNEYVKFVVDKIDIKCNIEYLEHNNYDKIFSELINKSDEYGIPISVRYCNSMLKQPLFSRLKNYDDYDLTLIGCRWAESSGRSKNTFLYYDRFQINYQPILDFKLKDVLDILRKYDVPLLYPYKNITRLGCVMCPLIFLRTKLSVNCVYAEQNKTLFDYEKFVKWLQAIYETSIRDVDNHYGALKRQIKTYIKNYERFKRYDLTKIELKENDWDIDFWYPEGMEKIDGQ